MREVDASRAADLVAKAARRVGAETSWSSASTASTDVDRPVHVNRELREAGLLRVRDTPTGETLDVFSSRAFAVADHQVAHVYTKSPEDTAAACECLRSLPGVGELHAGADRQRVGLDHARAGDIVAVAEERSWFTYYYWSDSSHEPDFARTVDIHRKPGYDPCELILDPGLRLPALKVAWYLARKRLGFRALLDVIPLEPELVRGSHGRLPDRVEDGPVFLSSLPFASCGGEPRDGIVRMESVSERVLSILSES